MAFPYSGQLKTNPFDSVTNDDDEFGEFTSAVTFVPVNPTGFPVCNQVSSKNVGSSSIFNQPGLPISLPIKSISPTATNGQVFFNPIPENDDEFGDFCGPVQPTSSVLHSKNSEPDLLRVDPEPSHFQPNYNIDLDQDVPSLQLAWDSNHVSKTEPDEDFGEFTGAEPVVSIITDCPPDVPASHPSPPIEVTTSVSYDLPSDANEELSENLPHLSAETDDEFGEFTQASILPSLNYEDITQPEEPYGTEDVAPNSTDEVPDLFALDDENFQNFVSVADVTVEPSLLDPIGPLEDPIESHPPIQNFTETTTDDDFGEFATFEADQPPPHEEAVDPDDEFDDFEVAEPIESASGAENAPSAENRIHQLLATVFPLSEKLEQSSMDQPASLMNLCSSARGALWSYLRELDSSPALSFQWRHSSTHKHFLTSLRIDSHPMNAINIGRWSNSVSQPGSFSHPVSGGTSNDSSPCVDQQIPANATPVTALDLDFFLSQNSSSAGSNSVSLLDSIEKELLTASDSPVMAKKSTSIPPTSDSVFDQFATLGLNQMSTSANGSVVDLLK